jgi:hypothetical protein
MKLVFFKRAKPRQFNYKPIYYDPVKEELEERKKEIDAISGGDPRARLKAEIRRKWHHRDDSSGTTYRGIRIIIYLFIAVLSIYFIFFTNFIENLFKVFGGQ